MLLGFRCSLLQTEGDLRWQRMLRVLLQSMQVQMLSSRHALQVDRYPVRRMWSRPIRAEGI